MPAPFDPPDLDPESPLAPERLALLKSVYSDPESKCDETILALLAYYELHALGSTEIPRE